MENRAQTPFQDQNINTKGLHERKKCYMPLSTKYIERLYFLIEKIWGLKGYMNEPSVSCHLARNI